MNLLRTPRHRTASLCAVLICTFVAVRAEAQEWVGTEVSAAVPSVVLGSSSARLVRAEGVDAFVRSAPFAVCDPSRGEYCAGMHVTGIEMNTFPHLKLAISLPAKFSLEGHLWTMSHEEVKMTLRQAVMGTTLRRAVGRGWYELGAGFASRAEDRNDNDDPRGVACHPGPLEPALLAGVGSWYVLSNHLFVDIHLRGGVSVGEQGADVFHANLVLGFNWQ